MPTRKTLIQQRTRKKPSLLVCWWIAWNKQQTWREQFFGYEVNYWCFYPSSLDYNPVMSSLISPVMCSLVYHSAYHAVSLWVMPSKVHYWCCASWHVSIHSQHPSWLRMSDTWNVAETCMFTTNNNNCRPICDYWLTILNKTWKGKLTWNGAICIFRAVHSSLLVDPRNDVKKIPY